MWCQVGDVAAWEALGREVGLPEGSGASFRDTYTTSLLPYEQAYVSTPTCWMIGGSKGGIERRWVVWRVAVCRVQGGGR